MNDTSSDIIIIGPIGVGKSTLADLLSESLQLPRRPLDEHRWDYYKEIGYDKDFAEKLEAQVGFWALYLYWKEFEIHAVERHLAEFKDCVIDFGGGHSVYENANHLARAKKVLDLYKNVFLLLPSPDPDESFRILNQRHGREVQPDTLDINEHFIRHPSNYELAKHTVYTEGRTPEETRDEILELVAI